MALLELLSAFTKISQSINNNITPECHLKLMVAPPQEGSFLLDLFVSAAACGGGSLFNQIEFIKYSKLAYGTLQGIIKIRDFLKKDPPISVKENNNGTTTITNGNNNQITINQNVYHLYTKPEIIQGLNKIIKNGLRDENATHLTIGTAKESYLTIDRLNVDEYLQPETQTDTSNDKIETEVNLWIVKPSFEAALNWKFVYKGRKIGMKVIDEQFNNKVNNGEPFHAGDQLIATVRIKQKFSDKYNTFIDDSYEILSVEQHIKRSEDESLQIG